MRGRERGQGAGLFAEAAEAEDGHLPDWERIFGALAADREGGD